jgi:DNA-binding protein HU-beta
MYNRRNAAMVKKELINYVAEKANLSKKDAEAAVNAVFDGIVETLKADGKVQLVGFGSFEVKERVARTGTNPATGAAIEIPASKAPVFKAGKALKESIK